MILRLIWTELFHHPTWPTTLLDISSKLYIDRDNLNAYISTTEQKRQKSKVRSVIKIHQRNE
jgi:hypothetical protein